MSVTCILLITLTYIGLGLRFQVSLIQHCQLSLSVEHFVKNASRCSWLSSTLRRKCNADESDCNQSFGVNTVQHASAIQSSACTLTGCSHILKTMMPRLTVTERERAIGRVGPKTRHLVATASCLHASIISPLCHRLQSTGTTGDVRWARTHAFEDEIFDDCAHELVDC